MSDEHTSSQTAGTRYATQLSRRQFFRGIRTGYQILTGKSAFKLSMLESLPSETLGQLVPMIVTDWQLIEQDEYVWGVSAYNEEPVKLFGIKTPAYSCFNLFGCMNSLDMISSQIAQEMGWESPQSFAYVRELFLSLVKLGICVLG